MWKTASGFLFALALTGCTTFAPVARIPFPEHEYAALPTQGSAIVKGQAFLRTVGGDVKTAAGEEVFLMPVTSYSEQWFQESYLANRPIAPADPRLAQHLRQTIADADGRFSFSNVPAGNYFVSTEVFWGVPTGTYLVGQTGGVIAKRIAITTGETFEVILTR